MLNKKRFAEYQTDIVGMAEEIQKFRNNNDFTRERWSRQALYTKLENWETLLIGFKKFDLLKEINYNEMLENVDTAKKFIKHDIIVSNCIDVAMDIKKFKEMI